MCEMSSCDFEVPLEGREQVDKQSGMHTVRELFPTQRGVFHSVANRGCGNHIGSKNIVASSNLHSNTSHGKLRSYHIGNIVDIKSIIH